MLPLLLLLLRGALRVDLLGQRHPAAAEFAAAGMAEIARGTHKEIFEHAFAVQRVVVALRVFHDGPGGVVGSETTLGADALPVHFRDDTGSGKPFLACRQFL